MAFDGDCQVSEQKRSGLWTRIQSTAYESGPIRVSGRPNNISRIPDEFWDPTTQMNWADCILTVPFSFWELPFISIFRQARQFPYNFSFLSPNKSLDRVRQLGYDVRQINGKQKKRTVLDKFQS